MSTQQQTPPQPPQLDPLIDEIRAIRKAISEQFGNDVDWLCDDLQQLEQHHPQRVITPKTPE